MKHLASLFLSAAALALPAHAGLVTYAVYFSATSGPNRIVPSGGSFSYDPASGFFDFRVQWDGLQFDMTAEANAPIFSAPHAGQCNEVGANWQFGFAILSESATGCNPVYLWDAFAQSGGSLFDFRLIDNPPPPADIELCPGCTGARVSGYSIGAPLPPGTSNETFGTWTLSPEPGTLGLMAAVLGLGAILRRRLLSA